MRVITSPWEKEKKIKRKIEERVIKDMFFGIYIYVKRIIRKNRKK